MKIVYFSKLLLVALVLSVSVTACKKNSKSPTPIYSKGVSTPTDPNNPGPIENPGPKLVLEPTTDANRITPNQEGLPGFRDPSGLDNYNQDREIFKQDTVYFDFDKYNVRASELSKIQSVASYLKGQSANKVLVEGHCDERGTPEYNRALGERRALSIREALAQAGIGADRVLTVSFGEDKPAEPGHNEAAWSKNRRGEFVLLKPKTAGATSDTR